MIRPLPSMRWLPLTEIDGLPAAGTDSSGRAGSGASEPDGASTGSGSSAAGDTNGEDREGANPLAGTLCAMTGAFDLLTVQRLRCLRCLRCLGCLGFCAAETHEVRCEDDFSLMVRGLEACFRRLEAWMDADIAAARARSARAANSSAVELSSMRLNINKHIRTAGRGRAHSVKRHPFILGKCAAEPLRQPIKTSRTAIGRTILDITDLTVDWTFDRLDACLGPLCQSPPIRLFSRTPRACLSRASGPVTVEALQMKRSVGPRNPPLRLIDTATEHNPRRAANH